MDSLAAGGLWLHKQDECHAKGLDVGCSFALRVV